MLRMGSLTGKFLVFSTGLAIMFVRTVASFAVEMDPAYLFCCVAMVLKTVFVMAATRSDVVSILR